jgi:hypothetical protein
MVRMTRKTFLAALASTPAVTAAAGPGAFSNTAFSLSLEAGEGLRAQLRHTPTGLVLADGEYSYSFGSPRFTVRRATAGKLTLEGATPTGIRVVQEYRLPTGKPWIEERIALTNTGSAPLYLPRGRCGFTLRLRMEGGAVTGPLRGCKVIAVPYRREPRGGRTQYSDYTLSQVLTELRVSELRSRFPRARSGNVYTSGLHAAGLVPTEFSDYASEGWILTGARSGFLISKYSQDGMEWSVLDRVPAAGGAALRWGGFGIYEGDPEHGALLAPGASHQFGVTRLTAFEGGLNEGYYAFRAEMDERGHDCPKDFDPPAHWNELYDNKLWALGEPAHDRPENRRALYTLTSMREEAAKARDYSCEALYLDPGWDTNFASKIWDEQRLGKIEDFVGMLKNEFGLKLSLHTPLSGWSNPTTYPREADRMERDGARAVNWLCGASRQYREETFRRLDALARGGATYFMFDGTIYSGECWDANHGHPGPARREEHVASFNRLARMVHEKHPRLLIEMHDQIVGGTIYRYVPTYYGQGGSLPQPGDPQARGWDDVWAYELMWDPMNDLVGGHAIALYYYNLAYSMPLYIHIDLRKDNANALMLWWNISCCRHLGLGGTHADHAVCVAQKAAMREYRRLKPFFARGTFYGIDELTHVHKHPTEPRLVVNCYNLDKDPATRTVAFDCAQFGLPARRFSKVVTVPAYGHALIEVS